MAGVGANTGFHFASDGGAGTLITTGTSAEFADDTGVSATDGLTSDPALTGTGDAGATLTFTDAGLTLGTTVVAADGTWSFTPAGLVDGVQTIAASEGNGGGDSASASVTFALATQAPNVTVSQSGSGLTNSTTDTIAGVATAEAVAGNGIASVLIVDQDDNVVATATLGAGGAFSAVVSGLTDGPHAFDIVTTDNAGNVTTTALPEVDVATQAPQVNASESVSGTTTETTDVITETATAKSVADDFIASVVVFDGATELGAATLSGGVWSFTASNLAVGAHDFSLVTTDAAGNATTTTLAPVDVISSPSSPTVSASETQSGLTNQTSDTIAETASAAAGLTIASVEVFDGANDLGAASFNAATGMWSFTAENLGDGVHDFSTVTTDSASNATTTTLAPLDVATAPPSVTASQNLPELTDDSQDALTEIATAEAVGPNQIVSVEVFDGATDLGPATFSAGVWSFTATLSDGANQLRTITTDAAGNIATTTLSVVHLATKPPVVRASESASGLTNQSSITVTERARAEGVAGNGIESVEVFDGASDLGAASLLAGAWTFTTGTLRNGANPLRTVTTDTAGNVTITALPVLHIATKPPVVKASESASGLTDQSIITIAETARAEAVATDAIATVEVFDGASDLGAATFSNGQWIFTTQPLALGAHQFSTVTTDLAGNSTTVTLAAVNVELVAPTVSIKLADDTSNGLAITSDDGLLGGGDPGATVHFTIDGSLIAQTATANGAGQWTFTPPDLSQGAHTIVASETNAYGTGSATLSFTYQATAPTVSIATPSATVAFPTETIDGAGEAGTTIQLYDGTQALGGTVSVGANGLWTESVTLSGAGAHDITAVDTDAAQNADRSSAITLFLDYQIPSQSSQSHVTNLGGDAHISLTSANTLVTALGGSDTVSLTAQGAANGSRLIVADDGSNTLDLSGIGGEADVDLGLQLATGSEIGTNQVFNFQNIIGGAGSETLTLNTAPGGGTGSAGGDDDATSTTGLNPSVAAGGFIQAGSGDDVMTGAPAGGNTYEFLSAFGADTITNFQASGASHDLFEVSQNLFANWPTLDAALSDTASGAELTLSPNETVTFLGVAKATLESNSAADFRFV